MYFICCFVLLQSFQKQLYDSAPPNTEASGHLNVMQSSNNMPVTSGMECTQNPGSSIQSSSGYLQNIPPKLDLMHPDGSTTQGIPMKKPGPPVPQLRLFTCNLCDKSYTRRDLLQRHKVIHTGIRDHVCTVCNKEFYRKDKLKRHEQIHLKDLNLFCRVCGKHCQRKDSLTRHEKTHEKAALQGKPDKLLGMENVKNEGLRYDTVTANISNNETNVLPRKF